MDQLNIFEYSDYREFLKAFYTTKKDEESGFSYRSFSMKAGFASPNIYHLVMHGKRNLTEESAIAFANTMELGKKEQQYFKILVSFNQARTPESRRYFMELLHNLKKDKLGTQLKHDQIEYVSNWYYVAIRELVYLPHFKEDPAWIRRQLENRITVKQAKDGIEKLLNLGLIKRDENGKLMQSDEMVATECEMSKAAVYSFHQQMLSLAKDVLAGATRNNHEISGTTMAVSERQFSEIKKMVHEFHESVQRYISKNPDVPQDIFQLNIQFFPLTTDDDNGKKPLDDARGKENK